jgi:hypothetical protein
MLKIAILTALLSLMATAVFAQGPTKVEGKPKTMTGGLEYWDIKEGTGAVAKAAKTSRCTIPDG